MAKSFLALGMTGVALVISLVIHGAMGFYISRVEPFTPTAENKTIKVKVVEKNLPPPPPPPPPLPPPPPPPPPEKKKEKPRTPPKLPSDQKQPPSQEVVKPILGVTKESMSDKGKGSVPLGNTTMVADEGIRKKEAPQPYVGDLSSDPLLIPSSVQIPTYSEAALDAGYEGKVTMDVYVSPEGVVTQAELRTKVGYGMDERLIQAALKLRYKPRKNKFGVAEPGWTEVKFTLQLP